jgi:ABC-type branched-subunit amino acid transport system substrate-binding protein
MAFGLGLVATIVSTTSTASVASAASTHGPDIVIGSISAEGAAEDNNNDRVATLGAAIQAINKAGGIHGRTVKLLWCNGEHDPNHELSCARELIGDHVDVVIGSEVSNPDVVGLLASAGIADVDTEALSPEEFTSTDSFLMSGGVNYETAGGIAEAKAAGLKKIFFISYEGSDYPPIAQAIAKKVGIDYVGSALETQTIADYDPIAAQVASSGADAVLMVLAPLQFVDTADAIEALGLNVTLMGNGEVPHPTDLDAITNINSIKVLITADVPPASASSRFPGIAQFLKELAAYHKKTGNSFAVVNQLRVSAIRVWMDAHVFADIANNLKTVNASTIKKAYATVKNVSTLGLTPAWTPSAKGCAAGYPRVSNPYEWYLQFKNGKFVLLNANEKPVSMKPLLCGS